jgi:hypothetical protein
VALLGGLNCAGEWRKVSNCSGRGQTELLLVEEILIALSSRARILKLPLLRLHLHLTCIYRSCFAPNFTLIWPCTYLVGGRLAFESTIVLHFRELPPPLGPCCHTRNLESHPSPRWTCNPPCLIRTPTQTPCHLGPDNTSLTPVFIVISDDMVISTRQLHPDGST